MMGWPGTATDATMAACASLQPMDELTRFRWELIAGEVVDRVFAEAGVDELLAGVAKGQDGGDGELQAAKES